MKEMTPDERLAWEASSPKCPKCSERQLHQKCKLSQGNMTETIRCFSCGYERSYQILQECNLEQFT